MALVLASTENMSHEDWLEYRRMGIGGSDAATCCGINRYKSKVELWMEKTGQIPDSEAGEPAYWGSLLESIVRDEFTKRTGINVEISNSILQSEEYPFMLANVDGFCQHPDFGTCIFEAKTASAYMSGEWEGEHIPDNYRLQLSHYMAVTGAGGAYIAVLIGGSKFKYSYVERDNDLIEVLIKLESEFWDHVQKIEPPQLDGSDTSVEYINQRFPDSIPQSKIELPDKAVELIEQYEAACERLGKATEDKQYAENLLKQMLGDNEIGTSGRNLVSWKSVVQERLDSKTLKVEHPTLYRKYANKSSHRRFSIRAAV